MIEDEQSAGLIMKHKRNSSTYKCIVCTDPQCDHLKVSSVVEIQIILYRRSGNIKFGVWPCFSCWRHFNLSISRKQCFGIKTLLN